MTQRRYRSAITKARTLSSDLIYPGYPLKVGVRDASSIRVIQQRLLEIGCGPISTTGIFDSPTRLAVQLLQARSVDDQGQALKIDGAVGPLTWVALFGSHTITDVPISPLVRNSLAVAASQVGVVEEPPGSNRGPQVNEYLLAVGMIPRAAAMRGARPLCIGPSGRRRLG